MWMKIMGLKPNPSLKTLLLHTALLLLPVPHHVIIFSYFSLCMCAQKPQSLSTPTEVLFRLGSPGLHQVKWRFHLTKAWGTKPKQTSAGVLSECRFCTI